MREAAGHLDRRDGGRARPRCARRVSRRRGVRRTASVRSQSSCATVSSGAIGELRSVDSTLGSPPTLTTGVCSTRRPPAGAILDVGCYPASLAVGLAAWAGIDHPPVIVDADGVVGAVDEQARATVAFGGFEARIATAITADLPRRAVVRVAEGVLEIENASGAVAWSRPPTPCCAAPTAPSSGSTRRRPVPWPSRPMRRSWPCGGPHRGARNAVGADPHDRTPARGLAGRDRLSRVVLCARRCGVHRIGNHQRMRNRCRFSVGGTDRAGVEARAATAGWMPPRGAADDARATPRPRHRRRGWPSRRADRPGAGGGPRPRGG